VKPRILALATHYAPGFRAGGPIRSLMHLIAATADAFDWSIVTSDRDLGSPTPYPGLAADEWHEVGPARVRYMGPNDAAVGQWRRLLAATPHDMLYLNSLFSPRFSIFPLLAARLGRASTAPVLIAPRGEAAPDALRLKAWKKVPYLAVARGLYRDVHWHASTAHEARDIADLFHPAPARLHVARNVTPLPESHPPRPRPDGPLRICFLSRVARMKNLEFVLGVVAALRCPASLAILGPREDPAYWHECEALLGTLPPWVTVALGDAVEPEQVRATLADHDVLFVPSRGENFGHVFAEAWAAGIPVLVSDRTPWRGLAERGVGWDLPLDEAAPFAAALEALASQAATAWEALTARCLRHAQELAADPDVQAANLKMLKMALGDAGPLRPEASPLGR